MSETVEKPPVLVEGAKAPAFRLPRDGGESVALADFSGRKLVLFFYPKADTPGCTREAMDFTRLSGAFCSKRHRGPRYLGRFGETAGDLPRQAQARGSADFG